MSLALTHSINFVFHEFLAITQNHNVHAEITIGKFIATYTTRMRKYTVINSSKGSLTTPKPIIQKKGAYSRE